MPLKELHAVTVRGEVSNASLMTEIEEGKIPLLKDGCHLTGPRVFKPLPFPDPYV